MYEVANIEGQWYVLRYTVWDQENNVMIDKCDRITTPCYKSYTKVDSGSAAKELAEHKNRMEQAFT